MWDSNQKDGIKQENHWDVGVRKLKINISDLLVDDVYDHLCNDGFLDNCDMGINDDCFIYVNVYPTGKIEVVGVNGHPIDNNKKLV